MPVKVVAIIAEATKVLAAQPSMIALPFASLALRLYFLSYALAVVINLITAEPTPQLLASAVRAVTADAQAYASGAYTALDAQKVCVGASKHPPPLSLSLSAYAMHSVPMPAGRRAR